MCVSISCIFYAAVLLGDERDFSQISCRKSVIGYALNLLLGRNVWYNPYVSNMKGCRQEFSMNSQRTTIADIAGELGLSAATVSNVIHGKTKKYTAVFAK